MQRPAIAALWGIIKYPLVLGLLVWLLHTAWPSLAGFTAQGIDWAWLLLGLVVFQIAILLFARRFQLVLRCSGINRCYRHVLAIYMGSIIYFFITPGGIGVEAARFARLKDARTSTPALLSALLVDRLFGMLAAVLLGVFGLGVLLSVLSDVSAHSYYLLLIGAVSVVVLIAATAYIKRQLLLSVLDDLRRDYAANKGALMQALLCSIVLQALMGLSVFYCARAIGMSVDAFTALWVTAAGMVLMVLPVNAGGFGLNDAGTALLFHAAGLPLADATTLALIVFLLRLWSGLQSGVLELMPKTVKNQHG